LKLEVLELHDHQDSKRKDDRSLEFIFHDGFYKQK